MGRFYITPSEEERKRQAGGRYMISNPGQNPGNGKVSDLESALSGAADAFTFGWGDELLGRAAGLGDLLGMSGLWGGLNGDQVTEWSRAQQNVAALDNPLSYGVGQFAGGMAGGVGLGGLARLAAAKMPALAANIASSAGRTGLLGRLGASTATGAVGGAAYGAGSAEDDKLAGAVEGAGWGGAFGLGLRGIGETGGQLYRSLIKPSMDAEYAGAKMMAKKFERAGGFNKDKFVQDVFDAPKNAIAMDVTPGGTQITMGAGVRPSMEKEAMRDLLDKRNNAMGDEAADMLWDTTLGKNARIDAGRRIAELAEAKKLIDYSEIDAMQINPDKYVMAKDFVAHHLRAPDGAFNGAVRQAIETVKKGNPNVTGLRIVGDQMTLGDVIQYPQFWRQLWTNVREDVENARHAAKIGTGTSSRYRELAQDASDLRKQLGDMLGPKWETKQAAWKALADEEEALRHGYEGVDKAGDINLGDWITEGARLMSGRNKDQVRRWIQQGALARVEDLINKADTGSGRADVLRSIMGNKSKINTLNSILGRVNNDGTIDMRTKFARLLPRLEAQRDLFDNSVKAGIGVNSHTADKIAAMQAQQGMTQMASGGMRGAALKALTNDTMDAFDERVSDTVLKQMQKSVNDIRGELIAAAGIDTSQMNKQQIIAAIQQTGGVDKWLNASKQQRMMALAMQAQRPEWRKQQMMNIMTGGLYANNFGNAILNVGDGII